MNFELHRTPEMGVAFGATDGCGNRMTGMQDQIGTNPKRHHPFWAGEADEPRITRGFTHRRDIKSDYRGEVKVILVNLGEDPFPIARGDRIAQLVPASVQRAALESVETLDDTVRGSGGFGSTGR